MNFNYFHKTYLNVELSKREEKKYLKIFSDIVVQKIINTPYVPGITKFIDKSHQKFKLFICTGTPINEIE